MKNKVYWYYDWHTFGIGFNRYTLRDGLGGIDDCETSGWSFAFGPLHVTIARYTKATWDRLHAQYPQTYK